MAAVIDPKRLEKLGPAERTINTLTTWIVAVLLAFPILGHAQEASTTTTFAKVGSSSGVLRVTTITSETQKANGFVFVSSQDQHGVNRVSLILDPDVCRELAFGLLSAADAADLFVIAKPDLVAPWSKNAKSRKKPKTDADCQSTKDCLSEGLCKGLGQTCIAKTDDDCNKSGICKDYGRCQARFGQGVNVLSK